MIYGRLYRQPPTNNIKPEYKRKNSEMGIYKKTRIQKKMMAIYEEKFSRWPVPFETEYIQTHYGETHVVVSGSPENPALILLPGLAVTSMMWLPNIASLAKHYRCFAVDVIGDHGKSRLNNPRIYPRTGKDYSFWLKQVYAGLGLSEAYLTGASNGGYAAINHALFAPEQVSKLVLMAPSGIELTIKKVLLKIFYYLIFPTDRNRKNLVNWFLGNNQKVQEAFFEQMGQGMQIVPKGPIPILISSNRLKMIRMPVMLILGENDPTISSRKAAERIRSNISQARIEEIPVVGHVLNYEASGQVEELVIDFLGTD
jgi:pimeloyl-ACP methyl ester carboxylesterase